MKDSETGDIRVIIPENGENIFLNAILLPGDATTLKLIDKRQVSSPVKNRGC
jgi:hypothetical protein